MRLQLLRQTVREHVQLDVDDHRHVPVDWLRRHRSQHALRSRHCRLYRRHGKCPLFGIYMHVWTLAKQTTSIYWCYAYMVLRALILYRRRRIINHLLTYLLTYLLILLTALQSEGTSQNLTNCYLHINNKHPARGVISPDRLTLAWTRATHGPKFKPIEHTCQVSSTSAQRSRSLRISKTLSPHGRTDGWTFDWFISYLE